MSEAIRFNPADEVRRARMERGLRFPQVGSLVSYVAKRDDLDRDAVFDVFDAALLAGEVTLRAIFGMQFFGLPDDAA